MTSSLLALTMALAGATTATAEDRAPQVILETTMGTITIELTPELTPATVDNFLAYVDDDFYTGLIFHRVIDGFVAQGGGVDTDYQPRAGRAPVINEAAAGESNSRGTIAMARTSDPNSATSQFFINLRDNTALDARAGEAGYTVFGRVVDGMDVVDAMAAVPTGAAGPFRSDAPREPIVITGASRVTAGQ